MLPEVGHNLITTHTETRALDLRGQWVLAKAIHANDEEGAMVIAQGVVARMLLAIQNDHDPASPVAWPILTEPSLAAIYKEAMHLYKKKLALGKELSLAMANAQLRKASMEYALNMRLLEEPTAQTLLQQLRQGETIELNNHSLCFDIDFKGLVGTNPYGQDYFVGERTIENVEHWRRSMLLGHTWGTCPEPSGAKTDQHHEDPEVRRLQQAIETVEAGFQELLSFEGIEFQ